MASLKKLEDTIYDIYKEAYRQATPSVDIDELINSGITEIDGWFMHFYLPYDQLERIIDEKCKEHKIRKKKDIERIRINVLLGASPTSIKQEVN